LASRPTPIRPGRFLPRDPRVSLGVRFWKAVLRPLGVLAMVGTVFAAIGHFMYEGPKEPRDSGPDGGTA